MVNRNKNRKPKEISAGSMADIAFLLLIFFLVATTINDEKGIVTKLNPYHENVEVVADEKEFELLHLYLNAKGEVMLEGSLVPHINLRDSLFTRIISYFRKGKKTVISLTHDRGTKYSNYLSCYNEIEACFNNLWNDEAISVFDKPYSQLSKAEKGMVIKNYPKLISEKEPTKFGEEFAIE